MRGHVTVVTAGRIEACNAYAMAAPLYSTFALVAETVVSAAVFYCFYSGYKRGKFPVKLAVATMVYETLFDISYMVFRVPAQDSHMLPPWELALGATHGILSLVMFAALLVYFGLAIRHYRRENFFRKHKRPTFTFLVFWTISVLSGFALYFAAYR